MIESFSTIGARLRAPLRLLLPILVGCVLIDALVHRSGWYAKIAEPDSNIGAVTNIRMLQARQFVPGAHNVLVFGDSRIGEGFSAKLANEEQTGLNFLNVAIPGSMPRTWWYLLRQFERDGFHPDTVVIGAMYAPLDGLDLADWPLDLSHESQLLHVSDYQEYLASFHSPGLRGLALRQLLLPTVSVQADLQSMLHNPWQRVQKLLQYRPGYLASVPLYPGRDEHMPTLEFNADNSVQAWGEASEEQKQNLPGYAATLATPLTAELLAAHQAYLQSWYLKIADWCQQHQVKLIVFPLARGPYHPLLPTRSVPSVIATTLANHPSALVLPDDTFDSLEMPQYFFDTLHFNHTGREIFSKQLATKIDAVLAKDAR